MTQSDTNLVKDDHEFPMSCFGKRIEVCVWCLTKLKDSAKNICDKTKGQKY